MMIEFPIFEALSMCGREDENCAKRNSRVQMETSAPPVLERKRSPGFFLPALFPKFSN